jgi:hypothetical protein
MNNWKNPCNREIVIRETHKEIVKAQKAHSTILSDAI